MSAALLFLLVAAALSLAMTGAWLAVTRGAKSGWVDALWAFLVGAAGVAVALAPVDGWPTDPVRGVAIAAIAALWSLRLGLHIAQRTLKGGEDPRYARLMEEWGASRKQRLFSFLQIQAAAALLLAVATFLAARNPMPTIQWSDIAGVAVLLLAVIGEGIADAQMARFRANPANSGKVCDAGLWGWSRHPNYFFQWLGWTGYSIVAIGPDGGWPWGWAALVGPAFMYLLLVHISGIPPLEAHMLRTRRPAFERYQRRVNAFWPGPPHEEKPA